MLDRTLEAEFEGYRKTLPTDEARRAFDERIERLLSQHGVDYVRGYVDALKDASSGSGGEWLRASATPAGESNYARLSGRSRRIPAAAESSQTSPAAARGAS